MSITLSPKAFVCERLYIKVIVTKQSSINLVFLVNAKG